MKTKLLGLGGGTLKTETKSSLDVPSIFTLGVWLGGGTMMSKTKNGPDVPSIFPLGIPPWLMSNSAPLGPYSRTVPGVLWWS